MIGSELFSIRFDQIVLANNIWVFDLVQNLVFVQTLFDLFKHWKRFDKGNLL